MRLTIFDLDHTLLPLDSDYAWGQFTLALGWVEAESFARRNDEFYRQYQAGTLDIHAYVRFALAALREQGPQAAALAQQQFMREVIQPALTPQALALVRAHQAAGDTVMIATSTNEFVVTPIAQAFGIEHLIAVQLERDSQGWFTGEIMGVPSSGAGKITRVELWLAQRGLTLAHVHSTFYSDSVNDLPLLERVNCPVVTNAQALLRELAQQRGWRVLDIFETTA